MKQMSISLSEAKIVSNFGIREKVEETGVEENSVDLKDNIETEEEVKMLNEEDEKKYDDELKFLQAQRVAERERAKVSLVIEKQRTKTERAKQGKGRIILRSIIAFLFMISGTAIATWIMSIFMPENVEKAISIFIK